MNKFKKIKNPIFFQGEKYLKKNKSYFEGWYFKTINTKDAISFIPGISVDKQIKKAFIQVITNEESFFIDYDIKDFKFSHKPFYIKIGNNFFSRNRIQIDISDDIQKLTIKGEIKYSNHINIVTNSLNPNIMGLFSYIPFMECNHAVISMQNNVNGTIKLNNKTMIFKDGIGYIEKDWGCSFPKKYIWCQGNNFKKSNTSFMLSIANIPFKIFNFKGLICSLIIEDKEYRFATYNCAKIIKLDINNNSLNITLKKGHYNLNIYSNYNFGLKLIAPVKGKMNKNIFESINEEIKITLKKNDEVIFSDIGQNCGLEIVN